MADTQDVQWGAPDTSQLTAAPAKPIQWGKPDTSQLKSASAEPAVQWGKPDVSQLPPAPKPEQNLTPTPPTAGEVYRGIASTLNPINIGKGLYHDFADKPTDEENAAARAEEEKSNRGGFMNTPSVPTLDSLSNPSGKPYGGMRRVGLGIHRALGITPTTDERLTRGVATGGKNFIDTGVSMAQDAYHGTPLIIPNEPGAKWDSPTANTIVGKYITAPAAAEQQKAQTAPTAAESIGHSVAEAVPFFGPIASHIGEKAGQGDIAGAVGEAATYGLAPELLKQIPPEVIKRIPTREILKQTPGFKQLIAMHEAFVNPEVPSDSVLAGEPTKMIRRNNLVDAGEGNMVRQKAVAKAAEFLSKEFDKYPDTKGYKISGAEAEEIARQIARNPKAFKTGMRLQKAGWAKPISSMVDKTVSAMDASKPAVDYMTKPRLEGTMSAIKSRIPQMGPSLSDRNIQGDITRDQAQDIHTALRGGKEWTPSELADLWKDESGTIGRKTDPSGYATDSGGEKFRRTQHGTEKPMQVPLKLYPAYRTAYDEYSDAFDKATDSEQRKALNEAWNKHPANTAVGAATDKAERQNSTFGRKVQQATRDARNLAEAKEVLEGTTPRKAVADAQDAHSIASQKAEQVAQKFGYDSKQYTAASDAASESFKELQRVEKIADTVQRGHMKSIADAKAERRAANASAKIQAKERQPLDLTTRAASEAEAGRILQGEQRDAENEARKVQHPEPTMTPISALRPALTRLRSLKAQLAEAESEPKSKAANELLDAAEEKTPVPNVKSLRTQIQRLQQAMSRLRSPEKPQAPGFGRTK